MDHSNFRPFHHNHFAIAACVGKRQVKVFTDFVFRESPKKSKLKQNFSKKNPPKSQKTNKMKKHMEQKSEPHVTLDLARLAV